MYTAKDREATDRVRERLMGSERGLMPRPMRPKSARTQRRTWGCDCGNSLAAQESLRRWTCASIPPCLEWLTCSFFSDVYEAYERSRPTPRPHFELLLSRIITESQGESHINYWRAQLRGSCIEDFPDLNYRTDGTDRSTLLCRAEMSSKFHRRCCQCSRSGMGSLSRQLGRRVARFCSPTTSDCQMLSSEPCSPDELPRKTNKCNFPVWLRYLRAPVFAAAFQYTALSSIFQTVSGGRRLFHTLFIYQRHNIPIHNLWQAIDGWSAVEVCLSILQ
ncbi:uncharacterized protein V1513DRAFT_334199 [Lipomyces chichibuensis]|uniref:uncharacterized protein n=1 Tax=Lipomyces chichibuensis TaxID=1546026 RepID=UPI003344256C